MKAINGNYYYPNEILICLPDALSLNAELRQRSWELPEKLLRRQNASTMDDTVSWAECAASSAGATGSDDVFLNDDCTNLRRNSALKKTESDASEGRNSSVSNISKERSGSNDSILDRDSDYSSGISTHLVAELEQQIMWVLAYYSW